MELTVEKANEMLSGYLDLYYSLSLEDVEITDTKGYWRIKELCDESCHHPIHMCLGCEGKMHHTISYTQHDRNDKGQFRSPYRVWKVLHEEKNHE